MIQIYEGEEICAADDPPCHINDTSVFANETACARNEAARRREALLTYNQCFALEQNQRLDDTVELALHHLERALQFFELKCVGGEMRRIHAVALD